MSFDLRETHSAGVYEGLSPFVSTPWAPTPETDAPQEQSLGAAAAFAADMLAPTQLDEDDVVDALPGYALEEALRGVREEDEEAAGFSEASTELEYSEFSVPAVAEEDYSYEHELVLTDVEAFEEFLPESESPYANEEEEAPITDLRRGIVDVALKELVVWERGKRYESESAMRPTLRGYWETVLSTPKQVEAFIDTEKAWSAAFICTCMKRAGAGAAFEKNTFHAGYTASAIDARTARDSSKFWAYSVTEAKPELGDIVVADRKPKTPGPCGGTTFENVQSRRTASTHGDIVVAVRPDSIDVVGGNVGSPFRKNGKGDTVAQKTLELDANGLLVQPGGCRLFAIVKAPGGAAVVAPTPVTAATGVQSDGIVDAITSLPQRIASAVRAGVITAQAGLAIARGERDEGKLTNIVFYAQHPELPAEYRIKPQEKALARDWTRVRDQVIRPLLRTLGSASAVTPTSSAPAATQSGVNSQVVARIDGFKGEIDRAAVANSVSGNTLRGIIAAESAGKARTGEGGSGYKGLMQAGRDADNLKPEVSLQEGAKKYVLFTQSMRRFFRDTLKQDFDSLPEDTRVRIVMAGYNAGPETVKRAMKFAKESGDMARWSEAEHYLRALVSTGAYNPVQSVLQWCVTKGHLTTADMAADLARLSGKTTADIQRAYSTGGKWNVKALADALRPMLFAEKTKMKNDGSVTFDQAQSRASKSLICAAKFKQSHTAGYQDTILRYKRYYDSRI
jgi:hypothetical protein